MATPPRKRPRSDSSSCSISLGRHTPDSIHHFLETLKAASLDRTQLADPSACISVVFPSLLRTTIRTIGRHDPVFQHMGVPVVEEILGLMHNLPLPNSIALLGTLYAGKTHLLALVAAVLFSNNERVVFLPDGRLVAEDPVFNLKLAFSLAFADDPQTMRRILQLETLQELVGLARDWREDVYILVDGFDQLGDELQNALRAASASHALVYTAWAEDAALALRRDATVVRIPSGFTTDEYHQWLEHFKSDIAAIHNSPDPYGGFFEYASGGAPGLLRPLFDYPGQRCVDMISSYRTSSVYERLTDGVEKYGATSEGLSKSQKASFFQLMNACVTETVPEVRPGTNAHLVDPRYFYFDKEGKGRVFCGVGRDAMIDYLRSVDLSLFTNDAWYTCVRLNKTRLRAVALTQICLTRIGLGGLSQADTQGGAMRICTFRQTLSFGWMFEEARRSPQVTSSFLCIPGLEVCKFLAAVIVRVSVKDKMAHLIPLQITTNQICVDLATPFFAVVWHKWESAIREEGYNVVHSFACVDSLTEDSEDIIKTTMEFREKVKFISPAYTVRQLSVAQLDPKLGRILRPDRTLTPNLEKRMP